MLNWLFSPFRKLFSFGPNVVTAIIAISVLCGGVFVIENPSTLPLVLSAYVFIAVVVVLGKYASWVLKAIFTLLLFLCSIAASFTIGSVIPSPFFHIWWELSVICMTFGILGYSFISYSGRSRWTSVSLAIISQFFTTFLLMSTMTVPLWLCVLAGVFAGTLVFFLVFKFGGKTRVAHTKMPKNLEFSDEDAKRFLSNLSDKWNVRYVPRGRRLGGHYILWDDSRSFIVYPVVLEQKFGHDPRTGGLMYQGVSVYSWLLWLYHKTNIGWKTFGADLGLVLLDVKQRNSKSVKYVGVDIPDTRRPGVIAVFPSHGVFFGKNTYFSKVFDTFTDEFGEKLRPLTSKQKKRLGMVGVDVEELL